MDTEFKGDVKVAVAKTEEESEKHILITILGEPQGKQRPRYAKTGAVYTPSETRAYEKKVKAAFWEAPGHEYAPFHGGVQMLVVAYYKIPESAGKAAKRMMREGRRIPAKKPDIDNIIKIVMDGLSGEAYDDDKQVAMVTGLKAYADIPHVDVILSEV